MGLLAGACALPVAAQSMALPAADPVGISRSGAQVAYGYSLEAAALNPALLAGLKEQGGVYLSGGLELMATQQSLESTQRTWESDDRNRALLGFGAAYRLSPKFTLGLKVDEPFLRHMQLKDDAPSRFLGDGIDLAARRLEAQAAYALNPNVSIGVGLGVARLSYDASSVMRLGVPNAITGLTDGLVEQRFGEQGSKVVPSYSFGVRWAINPRWTIGFAHQSGLKADLALTAEMRDAVLGLYANDGLSRPPVGTDQRAAALLAATQAVPGAPTLELPSQTTLGVRQRPHPKFTWEVDLRYTTAGLQVPGFAQAVTPQGVVTAPAELPHGTSHTALSASAELELGKLWTVRGGLTLDQRSVDSESIEPLLGGSRTSAFSIGAGYRIWGGELNLGYQFRQSEDQDTRRLDGSWGASGFQGGGTRIRVEGMGHLMALGFKKTF
jgi:long-subunit fatty acid transport protein